MNLWLIPLFPLIGFLINGLFGRRLTKQIVNTVAVGSVAVSFAYVLWVVSSLYPIPAPHSESYFTWIQSGTLRIGFDLTVDRLSALMLFIVTGVGLLIHIYSIGYMGHEGGYHRFFSFLNLFMFFMLILVLASNFLLLFVGWEGVGLCSYLLVGFYYLENFANDAGKKAFVVNRIGDFGFLLGMLLLVVTFHTLDFGQLASAVESMPTEARFGILTLITLLLFIGATGKSAQIPLYVWLPDAMAGPTPVSALIHAATMVTAGVYMIARAAFLYSHTPITLHIVALIGLFTAVLAATIGLLQNDIKKVFAYSTVSQLGYMFLGLGVGAYSTGIFHLMTHAFFKALLFLGAGSVIHGLSGEQDLRHMGGLRKAMPITFNTLLAASLAISGIPPFAGYFSKDAILLATYQYSPWMYWVGVITAGMTAFYVFRAFFLAFVGEYRGHHHPHESPLVMTLPLVVLAVLSTGGGFFDVTKWLAPMYRHPEVENLTLVAFSIAAGVIGIAIAAYMYWLKPAISQAISEGPLYHLVYNKYYVDEIYNIFIVKPIELFSRYVLWKGVDDALIDGAVDSGARRIRGAGGIFRQMQSGTIRNYATWVVTGSLILLIILGLAGSSR
jgi:NADH-quinone oxidoreductase subunit L